MGEEIKVGKEQLLIGVMAVLAIVVVAEMLLVFSLQGTVTQQAVTLTTLQAQLSAGTGQGQSGANDATLQAIVDQVIPKGVPATYGPELGVSFDQPDTSINRMAALENQITFTGAQLSRYVAIASSTSCEYCCGATTLVTRTGEPACGCAHSGAMRGLIKYLIKNHADWSDAKILEEANKWKALFFPQQTVQAEMRRRGLAGSVGELPGQVGGC